MPNHAQFHVQELVHTCNNRHSFVDARDHGRLFFWNTATFQFATISMSRNQQQSHVWNSCWNVIRIWRLGRFILRRLRQPLSQGLSFAVTKHWDIRNMASSNKNGEVCLSPRKRARVEDEPKVTVICGAQWGDEGKGKVVDMLATEVDVVCRCQVRLS